MILEILTAAMGPAAVGPIVYVVSRRAHQFRKMIHAGTAPHVFDPKIIRTPTNKISSRWCSICNSTERAWIHRKADEIKALDKTLPELERADIKWRFENDPDWVKVFGVEYDPKTFELIPQYHNGECGGPNDSCPLCNWEYDQRKAKARELRNSLDITEREQKNLVTKLDREEIDGYRDILWTVWDEARTSKEAKEEWDELLDEIGMMKNPAIREKIKSLDEFKRLAYLLYEGESRNWSRREEVWQNKLKNDRQYRKHWDYGY